MIIHVDMDAFYASVEQRDNPRLRGRPVIVGGTPEGRGVVAAASYEARRFGVRSAMSAVQARRRCPSGIFVPPRMAHYREVSRQVHEVFREVTDRIEPLSLDEAYLDVRDNTLGEPDPARVAAWIKARVRERCQLTASAGVGPNKLVAKIASDLRKPDGLVVVRPREVQAFLEPLPVTRLWSVGPATAARLADLGIRSVRELRGCDPGLLERRFGKHGRFLARLAWGDDPRPVQVTREAKSRGSETTFSQDVLDVRQLCGVIEEQAASVARSLDRHRVRARTVTLKLRYDDFSTITRSRSLAQATREAAALGAVACQLLAQGTQAGRRPVRLIGVSASNLLADGAPEQLSLPLD